MKLKLMILGLLVLGFTFTSQAQTRAKAPQVVKTQLKKGQKEQLLEKAEKQKGRKAVLYKNHKNRQGLKRKKAKRNDVFTPKEKVNLNARQDRARAVIYKKKHNNIRQ